ncbi:MAG: substrate-binding domain-containing protein, partial [Verrucomicrobiota bacterium]
MVVLSQEDGVRQFGWLTLIFICIVCFTSGCKQREKTAPAVLYTSQDQVYGEKILNEFTRQTGVEIRALYDSESAKTAGLAHRLRYESQYPECDIFWSNEELYARNLARQGLLEPKSLHTFGYRTRRLVINTNKLALTNAPKSLLELTNDFWRGKVAIAYPLFGTTSAHFLALRQLWGDQLWKQWCHGLVRNSTKVVDGNSVVVRMVGAGEAVIGLTDWDDINAGKKQGYPILELPLNGESIAIPNTVAEVHGAPHPVEATILHDWLVKPEVVNRLVQLGALEGTNAATLGTNVFRVDWSQSLPEMEDAANF